LKINGVHHIAIIASDYQKSKDFYTKILGLEIRNEVYRENRNSYKLDLDVGGKYQIELFSFENPPPRNTNPESCGLRHLAFEVDNIYSCVEELREQGVTVEEIRIDEHTGKRFTFFRDPDMLPLEIYEV
jgi:glyoxylase I family protein